MLLQLFGMLSSNESLMYLLLQAGVFGAFAITAVRARRTSPARLRELVTAVVFGLLLEEGDIIIFGTYSYNSHWFRIGYVPLAIALTWAMIIASAMNFSDALGLPSVERLPRKKALSWLALGSISPVADALWAILLDLSLDAVAIRLRLWTWNIPLDRGWFGVPWGNFYSWLFVAGMFSLFTRLVRRRQERQGTRQGWLQLAVPFLAYGGLLTSLIPFILLQLTLFAHDKQNTAPIFAVTLAVFAGITLYGLALAHRSPRAEPDSWLILLRGFIHLIFLIAILATGIYAQLPVLLWVALAMLAVEFGITFLLRRPPLARLEVSEPVPVPTDSRSE